MLEDSKIYFFKEVRDTNKRGTIAASNKTPCTNTKRVLSIQKITSAGATEKEQIHQS